MMEKQRILSYLYQTGLCLLLLFLGGCSHKIDADISAYETSPISVLGVTKDTETVTPGDLTQLSCVNKTVKSKNGNKTITVQAAGPTLDAFLEPYGIQTEQLKSVVFVGGDGYTKEFDSDFFLIHPEMILAVADGQKALDKDEQPMRLVIPGTTPDLWVRGVTSIQIERKREP